jgi:hypothetical protein
MRVTVSEELKKYCPLTIWQIIGLVWNEFWPLCFGIIGAVGYAIALIAIVMFDGNRRLSALASIGISILFCVVGFGPRARRMATNAVKTYWWRNRDGYWVIFSRSPTRGISTAGPVLSSDMGALVLGAGLHIVLPFSNKKIGYAIISGKSRGEQLTTLYTLYPNKFLRRWKFEPTYLNINSIYSELAVIRIIDPRGVCTEEMSLSQTMRFIGGFSREMIESASVFDAADILIADKARLEARVESIEADKTELEQKLAESESRFGNGMESFANVINAIGDTKRFVKSKEGARVRTDALQAYLRVVGINERLIVLVSKPDALKESLADNSAADKPVAAL